MKGWYLMLHFKKVKSLTKRFKNLKAQLSLEIVKQPEDIKRMRTHIIVRTIIVDFLFSIFAFSIKGAQLAIQSNLSVIAVLLLALYFSERVIESAYSTYSDLQEDNFRQIYVSVITGTIMELASRTQSKVFKKDIKGNESVMPHPELIKKSKDYVDGVWNFWWNLPIAVANIITLIVMIGVTLSMELTSGSKKETIFIMFLLLMCVAVYFVFGKKRIDVMKQYRHVRKENEAREEVLLSEINTIEFASTKDFRYHANRFKEQLVISRKVLANERLKLNSVFLKRSAVASFFMIAILIYKIFVGGAVNEEVFLGIVGISTVYSTILNKISDILSNVENTINYLIDIDKLYSDFANIYEVYNTEIEAEKRLESREEEKYEPAKIIVDNFNFSYDRQQTWRLVNKTPFEMLLGEIILVQGETGAGKTTGLSIFGGKIRLAQTPIVLDNGETGYLKTLTYHTDRAMANNFVLNEIILNDDCSVVDKMKLMEILDGLGLKDIFLARAKKREDLMPIVGEEEELVIEYMKIKTYKQFSSGQQQRIALAKLLYTLDESIEAILLDEAFNRLNDEVADKCVKFILNFVQKDRKRLVLIATHQLSVVLPYCTKEISFVQNEGGYSVIKVKQL